MTKIQLFIFEIKNQIDLAARWVVICLQYLYFLGNNFFCRYHRRYLQFSLFCDLLDICNAKVSGVKICLERSEQSF